MQVSFADFQNKILHIFTALKLCKIYPFLSFGIFVFVCNTINYLVEPVTLNQKFFHPNHYNLNTNIVMRLTEKTLDF